MTIAKEEESNMSRFVVDIEEVKSGNGCFGVLLVIAAIAFIMYAIANGYTH